MTTKSIRPVTRETSALVRDRGMRPVIVTVVGSVIEMRAKGLRTRETIDLAFCYRLAVQQRVAAERAERRARQKGPKAQRAAQGGRPGRAQRRAAP